MDGLHKDREFVVGIVVNGGGRQRIASVGDSVAKWGLPGPWGDCN